LDEVLMQLAAANGFLIEGLAQTAGMPAAAAEGDLRSRLEALLREYNHILVDGRDGRIVRVVISSHRDAAAVPPAVPASKITADPVDGARLSSAYGPRRHPVLGEPDYHNGLDLAAPVGTPIQAPADGVVVEAGWRDTYGRYVRIRHDAIYETVYGHLSDFAPGIHAGARVTRGKVIGFVGASGRATGAHLHYEILVDGVPVDPQGMSLSMKTPALAQGGLADELQRGIVLARAGRMIDTILSHGLGARDDLDLQENSMH
jgi:murein DD-endopeptidase MepM/ murein hydrolase activator NlpD